MKPAMLVTLSIALAGVAAAQTAKIVTPTDVFRRNTEPREQANIQFPPHKIVGNLYYVGSPILSSFLITTPEGHILINSAYEATAPAIRASIDKRAFRMP